MIYKFVFISRFHVFVQKNNKYGIIDLNNRIICPLIYDEIKPSMGYGLGMNDDRIYARKGEKFYEINLQGDILKSLTMKEFKEEIEKWNR